MRTTKSRFSLFDLPGLPTWAKGLFLFLVLAALSVAIVHAAEPQLYTCGMHPQIIKEEPGDCPICGMKLTPIRSNSGGKASGAPKIKYYQSSMIPGEVSPKPGKDSMGMDLVPVYAEANSDAAAIHIDPVTIQRMNLKTGLVTRGPVIREFRTVGSVVYDETGLRDITTKYEGWIEKLYVNTTWATVRAGDPLFEIYSPDLYNAGLNYVVALRSEGTTGGSITRSALTRLQLFDVPAAIIAQLQSTLEVPRTFVFRAPSNGVVIEKMALAGQMMKPGERIFRLADLSQVWIEAQIYEQDLPFVQVGQDATVHVSYGSEKIIQGQVDLLLPQVEDQTRTTTARIVLPNPDGTLRPGMYVDVRFNAQIATDAVLVPDLAVLRSGEHNTVFLANDDGSFEPREVKLGARTQGNLYQVLDGLAGGERVVTSGQFMLDSESQLRDAIQKMLRTSAAKTTERAMPPATDNTSGDREKTMLTPDTSELLKTLAFATIDGGDALALDDLAGYQNNLPAMRRALSAFLQAHPRVAAGPLAGFIRNIPEPIDLATARQDFAILSTAIADLARENHLHHTEGLHLFECPMAPQVGTGRWLQREAELRNPFFGSDMLTCGEEIP
ncbi:MAG: efflux RND transporter periplasmic adaptor subunit [Cephaloticoccus sp.]|nr:efflux RND transporter periplasmic adaptor subunit [Cephaloticoccus sp.]MCF7760543.1 efflux RND transporter periplasmic adaptor subunit [Cephaloticoccus sp.]